MRKELFKRNMNRAEDLGTGIRNVYKYLGPYAGTVPVFREEDLFTVEVPLKVTRDGGLNGGVNGGVNKLFNTIKDNPGKRCASTSLKKYGSTMPTS